MTVGLSHFQLIHLVRVGGWVSVEAPGKHVVVLVLHKAAVQHRPVHEAEYRIERAVEAHLLAQSPRWAASGSDSPTRGWLQHVLDHSPSEWYLPRARRCSSRRSASSKTKMENARLQHAVPVRRHFLHRAGLAAVLVDRDQHRPCHPMSCPACLQSRLGVRGEAPRSTESGQGARVARRDEEADCAYRPRSNVVHAGCNAASHAAVLSPRAAGPSIGFRNGSTLREQVALRFRSETGFMDELQVVDPALDRAPPELVPQHRHRAPGPGQQSIALSPCAEILGWSMRRGGRAPRLPSRPRADTAAETVSPFRFAAGTPVARRCRDAAWERTTTRRLHREVRPDWPFGTVPIRPPTAGRCSEVGLDLGQRELCDADPESSASCDRS